MIPRYYKVFPFDEGMSLFEVRWTTIMDGRWGLRAFGPASFAACQQFLDLVERQGLSHAQARDIALSDEREMVA
jgi:hypothetical protein